jgi:hypothetical protein
MTKLDERIDRSDQPRPSRKGKRLWFFLLTPMVIVLLLVLAGAWHHFYLLSQIEEEKEQIAQRGEPVTIADLQAAYALPAEAVDRTDEWLAVINEITRIATDATYEPLPIVGDGEAEIPFPGEAWDEEALAARLLTEAQPALQRLSGLIDDPSAVRYPLDFSQGILMMLDDQQNLRSVARVLSLQARWQVYHGDSEGALESLIAMLRAADTLEHEPTLVSQLIRMALVGMMTGTTTDLLPHANWSEAQLKRLQEELLAHDNLRPGMIVAHQGERAIGNLLYDNPMRYDEEISANIGPLLHADHVRYLRMYEQIIAAFELPHAEGAAELEAIMEEVRPDSKLERIRFILSSMILPAVDATHVALGRVTVSIRSTATLIACERYHLATGSWPRQLSVLTPRFMASVPLDPLDGQPLRYKVTPEAVIVYSVGEDLKDDGGTSTEDSRYSRPDQVTRRMLQEQIEAQEQ